MSGTKLGSTLSVCVVTTWLLAIPAATFTPRVQASGNAYTCVRVRVTSSGGQELVNTCNEKVEVTWCVYGHPGTCMKYTDTWTLGAGESYPIESGPVNWDACRGANSIRTTKYGIECE